MDAVGPLSIELAKLKNSNCKTNSEIQDMQSNTNFDFMIVRYHDFTKLVLFLL